MKDYVFSNADVAKPHSGVPPIDTTFGTADAKLTLVAPGNINARFHAANATFDVNISQSGGQVAINSDRLEEHVSPAESLGFFEKDYEVWVVTKNHLPGCLVEVTDDALKNWVENSVDSGRLISPGTQYRVDSVAAHLGRAAIRFLRSKPDNSAQNRITMEALALGISARAFARFTSRDGDTDAEIEAWKRRGDSRRIRRAIDWAEEYLLRPQLSVSDMSTAAGLSSAHFGVVFKNYVGESPYAYVLRRRAEFARDMIEGTDESIAQVAFATGFSSQAHLTTVMRRILGVTPGKLRKQ